jgi:hypothetical protein
MKLILDKNDYFTRFASCVGDAGLVKVLSQVARRAMDGDGLSVFNAGKRFTDDFKPAVNNDNNLMRCGIFRGKISRRKTQTNRNRLEERTPPAPNSYCHE